MTVIDSKWTPYLRSAARIVFGFLLLRHGMEQVFGYPEASDAARLSLRGMLEALTFPSAVVIMLGLFTRPVGFVLSILYLAYWCSDPLTATITRGQPIFGASSPTDPLLLSAFLLLYLSAAGPGPWSLDHLRNPKDASTPSRWTPHLLGALRIVAGVLFMPHGLEKMFGTRTLDPLRQIASVLETIGGPVLAVGLFTRVATFVLSGEMAVAYFVAWAPLGFWQSFRTAGQEASILNAFLFLLISAAGPGLWSLDGARKRGGAPAAAQIERATR
jgi:putative oxidoreductase